MSVFASYAAARKNAIDWRSETLVLASGKTLMLAGFCNHGSPPAFTDPPNKA